MTRSTRFPVAIHALAVLSIRPDDYCSSELIAKSAGTNSVVVRRVLSLLQKAGYVGCQPGAHGGAKLAVDPAELTLLDVYRAVEEAELFRLHDPHPDCPVAQSVKEDLCKILRQAECGMERELGQCSLAEVTERASRELKQSEPC